MWGTKVVAAAGWDTPIMILQDKNIMVVVGGIIINAVFGILIVVVIIVVIGEGPTLRPVGMIIIINDYKANGPIISADRVLDSSVVATIIIIIIVIIIRASFFRNSCRQYIRHASAFKSLGEWATLLVVTRVLLLVIWGGRMALPSLST